MKERIIGAVVLVVFAVLVVPIFLDGPPGEQEIVSERVLLPGQDPARTQTVVLERDRTEPMPAGTSNEAAEEAAEQVAAAEPETLSPVAQRQDPVPERSRPKPAETETVNSTTGMWAVQLGSFSNKDNAEKLAADLRKQGYAAFLSRLDTDEGTLHRVRIGPQKDRQAAETTAARLLKVDIKGQVVPHP